MTGLMFGVLVGIAAARHHLVVVVARRRVRGVVPARYSHCKAVPIGTSTLPRHERVS